MKISISLLCFCISTSIFASEKADSTKPVLKANANISFNSNGIASVPSFSLDKPAIVAAVSLARGRFSYEPTLAYGLDLRPWYIDNWFRYKIINKPSLEFRTGFDVSTFFSGYKTPDDEILQAQKYLAFEAAFMYQFAPEKTLSLLYWSDNGQDPGTIKGHFIDLVADRSGINLGRSVLLAVNVQLFYINYTAENDGLFISPKVSSSVRNIPLSLFFQCTQPFVSNIEPFPGFKWNLGIAFNL
jgi:hypothetical protein